MTQGSQRLALASMFEPGNRSQWLEAVADGLRRSGRLDEAAPASAAEQVLATRTYDGIDLQPLYTAADEGADWNAGDGADQDAGQQAGEDPVPGPDTYPPIQDDRPAGRTASGWDIRQQHAHPDPAISQAAVMADLENGVTSLWLVLGDGGIPLGSLEQVLQGVYLDLAPIVLDAGPETGAAANEFFALIERRRTDKHQVRGNLGADPVGTRARWGLGADWPALNLVTSLAQRCLREHSGVRAITVDAQPYHQAGGSDAEELGISIATGLAYLRELTGAGLNIDQALSQFEFRYAVSADQFATIAKLRAARQLWARVAQVCGAGPQHRGQRQHAVTSPAMMTKRDPWVNLLRTTLACFSAGTAGADAITVHPFDSAIALPGDFSRRIARNTSSLLILESNVARVIDPARGSWYVERRTAQLAQAAWRWFIEIEQAGGLIRALDGGLIEQRLAATWDERRAALATRRDVVTGVSVFPGADDPSVIRDPAPASPAGSGALPRHRYAEDYETLQDAADARTQATGTRPAVYIAVIGPASAATARATFAANLFRAGGFATPVGPPEGFAASPAQFACLAGHDPSDAESTSEMARKLKEAGAQRVWLTHRPAELAGIDGYVYEGCDVVALLQSALAGASDQAAEPELRP